MPSDKRFFLDRDDSGHWYVVPNDIAYEWLEWLGLDDPEPLEGVIMVPGGPRQVTFCDPVLN